MKKEQQDKLMLALAGASALLVTRAVVKRLREYDLRGKTVLITGGSRGLGLVMAREFAREGARVAICARDAEELDRARMDLVRRGSKVMAVPCDITHREQVNEMVCVVIGTARAKGKESESNLAPSWLTTLSEHAAARNNEIN